MKVVKYQAGPHLCVLEKALNVKFYVYGREYRKAFLCSV